MKFGHEQTPPEMPLQTEAKDHHPQVGQNWTQATRLEMNAYLLTHPGLSLQPWFEKQITNWGVHPMAPKRFHRQSLEP